MYICTDNFVYVYLYMYTCIYLSISIYEELSVISQIDCVGLNGHCRDLAFTVRQKTIGSY